MASGCGKLVRLYDRIRIVRYGTMLTARTELPSNHHRTSLHSTVAPSRRHCIPSTRTTPLLHSPLHSRRLARLLRCYCSFPCNHQDARWALLVLLRPCPCPCLATSASRSETAAQRRTRELHLASAQLKHMASAGLCSHEVERCEASLVRVWKRVQAAASPTEGSVYVEAHRIGQDQLQEALLSSSSFCMTRSASSRPVVCSWKSASPA